MNNETATVFYVDDNARSRRFLSSVLAECGFEVVTAGDPLEALACCGKISFDVALLDYQMPSLTGSQLAEQIHSLVPSVPIVLISGAAVLAPSDLLFVDAHFGRESDLDDLVQTMWKLAGARLPVAGGSQSSNTWSDTT